MNIFRFAVLSAIATFVLLAVGGLVNPTGSSLACPDWPTCYGSFFPAMKDGVEFEHTHRVVATLVGLLAFALAYFVNRNKGYSKGVRRLTVLASLLVIFQGVLGGVTVIYKLPLFVSTAHLAISMIFFSLQIYIAFRLYHERDAGRGEKVIHRKSTTEKLSQQWLVLGSAIAVYLQIILGAFVRHTHSGRSCGTDIPFCQGEVWPTVWPQKLHMLHRYFGVAVALIVIFAAASAIRAARERNSKLALYAARIAPTLVLLQIFLGIITVTSFVGLIEVELHLSVGALLLANMWALYLALLPSSSYVAVAQDPFQMPIHEEPVLVAGDRVQEGNA